MEVLVAAAILVVGIWAMLQVFGPGMGLKKHAAVSQSATRFAEGQRIRFGELPVALVKRDPASGLVDFSISSLEKSPRESIVVNTASGPVTISIEKSWDYLYEVRTVVGEKVKAGPYVFLRFGPSVRATQLAYFPEPYHPDQTSADLASPVAPASASGPSDLRFRRDSWTYNRYCYVDEDGDGTPDATYLTFDEYAVGRDLDTNNEPRWVLLNYSYVDAAGQVKDVVGVPYEVPPSPDATLTADLLALETTTMFVTDASALPAAGTVLVGPDLDPDPSDPHRFDGELISYASRTGTSLDGLTRGVSGTTPVDHAVGTPPPRVVLVTPPATIRLPFAVIGGTVIPGSESVFRIVGTSLYPPLPTTVPYWYAALPYQDDDPATPLIDESTPEGPGVCGFSFRTQDQTPNQVALPLPGETLLVNYDFAGHLGRLDFGATGNPSYANVSLPEVVWEDHQVPSAAPYEIHLDFKPLEGDSPLTDACPSYAYVMAVVKDGPAFTLVDLDPGPGETWAPQSGRLYPDATPNAQDRTGPNDTPFDIDMIDGPDGVLRFAPEIAGKWVRVFYRVQRRWIGHVVKSAAEYAIYTPGGLDFPGDFDPATPTPEPCLGLPAIGSAVWDPVSTQWKWNWRVLYDDPSLASTITTPKQFWLTPTTDIDPVSGQVGKTTLSLTLSLLANRPFYKKAEVAVDYVYDAEKRVSGEEHQIDNLSSGGYGFTLNHPDVTEIISIRGASARVRVAWRSPLNFHKLKTYELRTEAIWRGSEND